MILAIDVGNTNITLGCLDKKEIYFVSRLSTDHSKTADEYALVLKGILDLYHVDVEKIHGGIISSVVPALKRPLSAAVEQLTGKPCMVIGSGLKTGLNILIDNPAQLGSDLVVDAVAALAEYSPPIMIFDMGTATTLSVIDAKGNYRGGMIIPGIMISLNALSSRTSQLQRISLEEPRALVGTNTIDCMKSGIIYGNAAMLDGIIDRITDELGEKPSVVATGGLASVIVPHCRREIAYDDNLMLKGLRLIYEKNQKDHKKRIDV